MSLVFSIVNIRDLINVSILGVWHSLNIINISLTSKNFVYSSCFLLKYHTLVRAILLTDVCVIDYPNKSLRFKIVYNILSIKYKMRYLLYCSCSQFETLSTLTPLFNNAGWSEREAWDLFGLFFLKNLDLRRLLTDYGFEGHPLRKDFPLTGYYELGYSDKDSRLQIYFVELPLDFRIFYFESPWEQVVNVY